MSQFFFSNSTAFKKEDAYTFTTSAITIVLNVWASKNVTSLLVSEARSYLEKQKQIVQQATSNREAQNIIAASLVVDNKKVLETTPNPSKSEISIELKKQIGALSKRLIKF